MLESKLVEIAGPKRQIEAFSLSLNWITQSTGVRLDASYYNPRVAQVLETLRRSGLPLERLEDVTKRIFVPPRFKRIYVSKDHGIPFLQGSHIVHFQPANLKYLSRAAHKNLHQWIIEEGWVLVTCSGTIGRVSVALPSWHGWAASQHILRIVPDQNGPCPSGYIYAYLSSPIGQAQFNGVYGAVVDELTAEHVKDILIPVPKLPKQKAVIASINNLALEAMKKKEEALGLTEKSILQINDLIK